MQNKQQVNRKMMLVEEFKYWTRRLRTIGHADRNDVFYRKFTGFSNPESMNVKTLQGVVSTMKQTYHANMKKKA